VFLLGSIDLLTAVSGIAIIPESLIAVLTITMAVGMKRMVKRKVIVRKLDALEALGGVTNICSDKTGTLTQGKMVTRRVWIPGIGIYSVDRTGESADPTSGIIRLEAAPVATAQPDAEKIYQLRQEERDQNRSVLALKFADESPPRGRRKTALGGSPELNHDGSGEGVVPELAPGLGAFLYSSALCNLATVRFDDQKQRWQATGDPTEVGDINPQAPIVTWC
jgi:magnesium-transporting ATPase (P-type)